MVRLQGWASWLQVDYRWIISRLRPWPGMNFISGGQMYPRISTHHQIPSEKSYWSWQQKPLMNHCNRLHPCVSCGAITASVECRARVSSLWSVAAPNRVSACGLRFPKCDGSGKARSWHSIESSSAKNSMRTDTGAWFKRRLLFEQPETNIWFEWSDVRKCKWSVNTTVFLDVKLFHFLLRFTTL